MHDTLIFDLDGTLVHSAPDLARALNHTLARYGVGAMSVEAVSGLTGDGIPKLVERGFGASGFRLTNRKLEEAIRTFESHYAKNAVVDSELYPGAQSLLDALTKAGMKLAVCTNKLEPIARDILEKLRVAHCFEIILGGHAKRPRKPDPAPLWEAVEKSGGSADRTVMIGDSKVDLDAARAARIPVILVSFGYSKVPASQLGADAVIDSLSDLPEALAALPPDP
jgi:phosphoglycolate phosphatase